MSNKNFWAKFDLKFPGYQKHRDSIKGQKNNRGIIYKKIVDKHN